MEGNRNRMTRQRALILAAVRNSPSHPTAEEVFALARRRLPRISLGTVYRNLDYLAACGEIRRIECGGRGRRFDGNTGPHQHVRCVCCGRVGDVATGLSVPQVDGLTVEGFTLLDARIEFDGLCARCAGGAGDDKTAAPGLPGGMQPDDPGHERTDNEQS